ncbi:SDR family oxidoreductase [Aurantivibrio plasticivorans]
MTRTVVITGANRGIGLALTEHFLAKGDTVYALCRKPSAELSATAAKVIANVEVTDTDSLKALRSQLDGIQIDILINNAGILERTSIENIDDAAFERQYRVNSLAPLKVTAALRDLMPAGSKLALVTSRMGSMADNSSGGQYGYRMSKAALNAAGVSLAQDLAGDNIAVAILHPGFVQTDMVGGMGDVTPQQSASGLAARIEELTMETSGTFWHANGDQLPW